MAWSPRASPPTRPPALIPDGAVVTVVLVQRPRLPRRRARRHRRALRRRRAIPRNLTTLHPIAAGDMCGIKGIDHLAKPGLLRAGARRLLPVRARPRAEPPAIWQMIAERRDPAYNVPSGILFDMHREAAAKRPGVLTKVGLDTFVDPDRQGCAMNASAPAEPIVRKVEFAGDEWLFFPTIVPHVAIIRATTADERGNLTYEHEGAYLGAARPGAGRAQQWRHRHRPGEAARRRPAR